jgi:uncharacterized protein
MASNLDNLRDAYAACNAGDHGAVLSFFAEDIHWEVPPLGPDAQTVWDGPQAVGRFFRDVVAPGIPDHRVEPESYHEVGENVVALGRHVGTAAATGKPLDVPFAHVWSFRNGKAARFYEVVDLQGFADAMT